MAQIFPYVDYFCQKTIRFTDSAHAIHLFQNILCLLIIYEKCILLILCAMDMCDQVCVYNITGTVF